MTKNAIAAVVGSLCALLLCEPHSFGQQDLTLASLSVTGTSALNALVSTTGTIGVLTSGSATMDTLDVTGPAVLQGGMSVSGTADILGNSLYFGFWLNDPLHPGVSLLYTDGTSAASPSRLTFSATRPSHEWLWERENTDQTGPVPTMKLDANHVLTIYNTAGTAAIVLDPSSPSNPSAVLTQQVADSRYVSSANFTVQPVLTLKNGYNVYAPAIALTGGTATGAYSFAGINATSSGAYSIASGENSTASGEYSTASGKYSTASGDYSTASGENSTASGDYSTASGENSTASGENSTASGVLSIASGYGSTASGYGSTASGRYSTASGVLSIASGTLSTAAGAFTTAAGFGQFVVGQYNILQGNPNTWVSTDDLFVVGNGTRHYLRPMSGETFYDETGKLLPNVDSNAFVVKKNGDTTVYGKLTVSGSNGSTDFGNGFTGTIKLGDGIFSKTYGSSFQFDSGINLASRAVDQGLSFNQKSYIYGDSSSNLHFLTVNAGGERMTILAGGNIGIGTTTPQATLDVNGSAKVAGNLMVSGTTNITGPTKVTGGIVVTGTMDSATNTVVASGTNQLVLIPQQGDLSMGTFTAGAIPR